MNDWRQLQDKRETAGQLRPERREETVYKGNSNVPDISLSFQSSSESRLQRNWKETKDISAKKNKKVS